MKSYTRTIIAALVISLVLSLWFRSLIATASGFTGPITGLFILFLQFIVIPFCFGVANYSRETGFKWAIFSFGIALLVAIAVAAVVVVPASVAARKERKLRCEQDNERMKIYYETHEPPQRKDGAPFVFTPSICT